MFTKEQLDKWISEGFDFTDPIYKQAAVEKSPDENAIISFIKIIQPNIVEGNTPQFSLIIYCATNIDNIVEIDIDNKVYQAYLKKEYRKDEIFPITYLNYYYADLSVTIPMLYTYELYKLTVRVKNPQGRLLATKTINIKADNNGIVKETQWRVPQDGTEADTELVTYRIYWNSETTGKIEKLIPKDFDEEKNNQIQYIYHDKDGKEHFIGKFAKKTIKNVYGPTYGGKTVDLVDIRELKNYRSDTIYFRLVTFSEHKRFYIKTSALGSLIGAMCECPANDYVSTGFSNEKGGSDPSTSHLNGQNGDLLYLRKDYSGLNMDLRKSDEKGNPCGWKGLDQVRQNKFNDALFKFGWRDMLSWEFDNGKKLNHSRQFKGHYNHLHLQDYNLNILKIKNL